MAVSHEQFGAYLVALDDDDLPMSEGMKPDPTKFAQVLATSDTPAEVLRRQSEYLVPVRART